MQWVSRVTAGCQEWREGSEEKERGGEGRGGKSMRSYLGSFCTCWLSLSCNAIL